MPKPSLYESNGRVCFVCRRPFDLHRHHVFPGNGRRDVSEEEGCWLYLCDYHHNMSNRSVHMDRVFDMELRRDCQRRWEEREGKGHEDFIRLFGESYL